MEGIRRLFIAITVPETLHLPLVELQHTVPIPGAKWTDARNFHITLRFLGNIKEALLPAIHQQLSLIKGKAFFVQLTPLGTFNEKVLWAGVAGEEALTALKQAIDHALEPVGIAPEPRPFQPHITLARLKHVDPHDLNVFLETHSTAHLPGFHADHFVLYESIFHDDTVTYVPLHIYALG